MIVNCFLYLLILTIFLYKFLEDNLIIYILHDTTNNSHDLKALTPGRLRV